MHKDILILFQYKILCYYDGMVWYGMVWSNINYLQKRNIYIINVTGVTGVTTNIIYLSLPLIIFLNWLTDSATFASNGRLFHNLAPL